MQQQAWDDEMENRIGVNFHPLLEAAAHDAALNKIQRQARPKKFGIPRQRVWNSIYTTLDIRPSGIPKIVRHILGSEKTIKHQKENGKLNIVNRLGNRPKDSYFSGITHPTWKTAIISAREFYKRCIQC